VLERLCVEVVELAATLALRLDQARSFEQVEVLSHGRPRQPPPPLVALLLPQADAELAVGADLACAPDHEQA
jgi:hypothetical protein